MRNLLSFIVLFLCIELSGASQTNYQSCQDVPLQDPSGEYRSLFQDQLRQHIAMLVESRNDQLRILRRCFEEVANPMLQQLCQQLRDEFLSQIPSMWREMRIHLALSRPLQLDEPTLPHKQAGLTPMPGLSPEEKSKVMDKWTIKMWAKRLSNKLSDDKVPLHLLEQSLREESESHYYDIINSIPLLGHIKSDSPSHEEIALGLKDIEEQTRAFLAMELHNPYFILSFGPVAEEVLKQHPEYCPDAEALVRELGVVIER